LLGGIVAQLILFGLGEDAEECRVAVRHPMPKGESTNENGNACKDGIEEVERTHCADAYKVKQGALDAYIGEGLMQAFEDPIGSSGLRLHGCYKPLVALAAMEG
jgi:hypothetical protein